MPFVSVLRLSFLGPVLARLREPSSWAALGGLFVLLTGRSLPEGVIEDLAAGLAAAALLAGLLLGERGGQGKDRDG